jgi:hypothetical protein
MKRRLNPAEVRGLCGILTDPQYDNDEDPYDMASAMVRSINDRREKEKLYAVNVYSQGKFHSMWGPYTTRKAAEIDIINGDIIGTKHPDCHAVINILVTSDTPQEDQP